MHEVSLAQDILAIIMASLKNRTFEKVVAVNLKIGPVSGVDPEALRFALAVVTENTPLAGADFRIETPPLRLECRDCRQQFAVADFAFSCPACGSNRIQLLAGDEMEVVNLEVLEQA
ncbi:MAG TPA: hydrogenase maturation nickel metallochaperone HypA [Acidobacteriota bacterium]|nr:hydrogenase maturation nickel metallochaperone HypA [Acidobacteriota bacterium]HQF87198.1 hydrogenase maturation nickel metallochaperone HypA [Acidobacteriota bacterium]HQG91759.1 hydrogenase maturation nickel metallochaperone HypA [Acidobacteriota bacterium]HQK87828.1 hydrogenase maturation nickel metallochaperone HypA [Acidobacteriota bacterium]